ncbi:MAG TPA: cytochrome c [Gammaproteobacteria bacterium]|nr:cytochrome c [Gammaproteobacteria bacterium]
MRNLAHVLKRWAGLWAGVALAAFNMPALGGDVDGPHLGRPASAADIAAWQLNVFPDGTGLPAGRGTAKQGAPLFAQKCASCHGEEGIGGTAEELAGGREPLTSPVPDKNIGTYWPYATTIFDFTRRSMPMDAPGSLSADEIYAITAYLLFRNGIIKADEEMNARTLPKVKMPNRNGFIWIDAKDQPAPSP